MKMSNRIVLFNDGDLNADVSSAAKDIQTIYIQAVSGTQSVNAPTTWVSVSDESVSGTPPNASAGQTPHWTRKKPTYQSNYPVIFVAEQRRGVNATTPTCTVPVKDDTTTIIDGGHITTGTIDASKVNVTNIDAGNIIANTLTIGRVQGLNSALDAAGDTAESYITDIDSNKGITIKPLVSTGNDYLQINSSAIDFYRNGTSMTHIEDASVRVGDESDRHVVIDTDSIDIKDGELIKASFGDSVRVGSVSEYNTVIDSDAFCISSGYENVFRVANGTGTKQITATDVYMPYKSTSTNMSRSGSLWIKANTTYTFTLYLSSEETNSVTFDTSVDGTSATTKTFKLQDNSGKNTVTLVFTPATDSSGAFGMLCRWTQTYERGVSSGMGLLRFFAQHVATIANPQMSFVGDINLTDGATYKVNGNPIEYVVERGTAFETDLETNDWNYEKWSSGKVEAWAVCKTDTLSMSAAGNMYKSSAIDIMIPSGIFPEAPTLTQAFMHFSSGTTVAAGAAPQSARLLKAQIIKTTNNTNSVILRIHAVYYPSGY